MTLWLGVIALLALGGVYLLIKKKDEGTAPEEKLEPPKTSNIKEAVLISELFSSIRRKSDFYKLNPAMVLALAEDESGFNPKAVNTLENSLGLFQIRPIAFQEWVNRTENKQGWTHDQLLDTEKNIEVGVWYLAWIRDTEKRSWVREPSDREIILAFKGGITNVLKKTVSDEAIELTERTLAREVKFA